MLALRNFSLSSSAECGRVAEFLGSVFRGNRLGIRLALVKVMLAVSAGWERPRMGHYGAITNGARGRSNENTVQQSPRENRLFQMVGR